MAGISVPTVVMMRLNDQKAHSDPYDWCDRTHKTAHKYCQDNFEALADGEVIDVQFILGETDVKCLSERYTAA